MVMLRGTKTGSSNRMRKRPSKLSIPKNQDSGQWFGEGKTGSGEKTIAGSKEVIAMTDLEKGVFEDDWELQVDIGKGSLVPSISVVGKLEKSCQTYIVL